MNRLLIWLIVGWLVYRLLQQQKALQQANARIGVIEQSLGSKITTSDLDYRLQNATVGGTVNVVSSLQPTTLRAACLAVSAGVGRVSSLTLPGTSVGSVSIYINADGPYVAGGTTDRFFFSNNNGLTATPAQPGAPLYVNIDRLGYKVDADDTITIEFFQTL